MWDLDRRGFWIDELRLVGTSALPCHPRVWMVLSHEFDAVVGGDVSMPVRDWLTRHGYGVAEPRQYRYVRVLEYRRREQAWWPASMFDVDTGEHEHY